MLLPVPQAQKRTEAPVTVCAGLHGCRPVLPVCAQVRAAGLLAQLYVQRGAYERAAGVHEALALRQSGHGPGEEVSLQSRVDALHDAVLQVRCRASPIFSCIL